MARERQFDESEALAAAADVFARHGFQGSSLALLMEATGLAKQSLYNCFGDKRSLYLKALEDAASRHAPLLRLADRAPNGRAALAVFFEHNVSACVSADPAERQCVVSAGLLEGVDDPGIRGELLNKWGLSREMLRAMVERGQKDGSIANPLPSAVLADLLVSLLSGLRVTAKAGPGAERLRQAAALGLSLLDQAGPQPAQGPPPG